MADSGRRYARTHAPMHARTHACSAGASEVYTEGEGCFCGTNLIPVCRRCRFTMRMLRLCEVLIKVVYNLYEYQT